MQRWGYPLLLAVACAAWAAETKRAITETDLYAFQWIGNAQISPDGSKIAYTHAKVNAKKDGYETALRLIPASGGSPRQLTRGPQDSEARWSPDGRTIAFLRGQPAEVWLLPMDGGDARQLTQMPKAAGSPVWSPDGKSIAFTSTAIARDFEKNAEPETDVRIITRAEYRNNGSGYSDPARPGHIWVVDVPAILTTPQKARQVTQGAFSESEIAWSKDSSKIYFTSERVTEAYYEASDTDVYSVPASGGEITRVASIDGPIRQLSISPDGTRMAFVGSINRGAGIPERSYSQPDLFMVRLTGNAAPKNLTADWDFDIAGSVGGDQAPPRGGGSGRPFWSADGRSIFISAGEEGRVNLKRIDAETGKVEPLTTGDHSIFQYHATPDGTRAAALISTPTNIGDLYLLDGASGKLARLTHINQEFFSNLNLIEPEMFWYKSFDGRRVQAWAQRPPDFQPGRKYPLILDIHGGPHSAYGYVFDHEFQWMAAKGYIVLYPNPRGSTTYGQEFGNVIQYRYPGDDFKDLMAGVDELIARGWVDPEKLGVTGGSGGGVLTNWAIGHTKRFKAAVSQRSIADWTGFWYAADFSLFTPTWFRGAPWEDEADFKARSPITYVKDITTPLMLIEGESDLRTPPYAGGEQMFRALKYLRRPTVMVRFPGETHELSRSGKPLHRVERLQHIVAWFDKYVLGQDIRTYDVR